MKNKDIIKVQNKCNNILVIWIIRLYLILVELKMFNRNKCTLISNKCNISSIETDLLLDRLEDLQDKVKCLRFNLQDNRTNKSYDKMQLRI